MNIEDFYLLSTLAGIIILLTGFGMVIHKMNLKLVNDERIIERLDILINEKAEKN